MSAPMKIRRTEAVSEVTISKGNTRVLYLVPKDKAKSLEALLNEYRMDDFIPADIVFSELHSKYGKSGVAIKGYRIREGLSQTELAGKMDCPQSWISGWESGKRSLGKKMAQKLAKIFKTDYRVFL